MLIVWIALGLLLALFLLGGYVFFHACGPFKNVDWSDPQAVSKSNHAAYSDHILAAVRYLQDSGAQDLYTRSRDGLSLHAQWLPAENARGTVVLVHGFHSSVYVDFGLVLELYHDLGFNLLMPDQRCHGQSEGRYVTFGVRESEDIACWLEYHNSRFGAQPVLLSGLSMGAATVMFMADEPLPDNVRYCIADCGFTSPAEIIGEIFTDVTHLPAWTVMWSAELFARVFARFSLWQKRAENTLAHNARPFLFVHGLADDFVPCQMTRRAHAACTGEKYLLLVEGAGHGLSFLQDRERYLAVNMELMDRLIPKREDHNP